MTVVPGAVLDASPPASMPATGVEELQLTVAVRSTVEPSLNVPVAVNCCAPPTAITALTGDTASDCRTAAVTVNVADPLLPSTLA